MLPKSPRAIRFLDGPNAIVEQKHMSDRQQPVVFFGQFHQCFGVVDRAGQRFFHQHMLAGFESRLGQRVVRVRRRRDHDGIGGRIGRGGKRIGAGADRRGDIARWTVASRDATDRKQRRRLPADC